jgi:hypothetical protein
MLQIPEYWRSPQYEQLNPGFKDTGPICLSVKDSQRLIRNQALCDSYRKDMLDLLDAVGK